MAKLAFCDYHNMVAILEKTEHNTDFHQIVDFLKASHIRIETTDQETKIIAIVDGKPRTISESSLRRHLKLNDEEAISSLPDAELFENLSLMGYNILPNQKFTFQKGQFSHKWKFLIHTIMQCLSPKSTGFNEFSSNIATAVVCLATNRVYNFSKMIFDGMARNINSKGTKFLLYHRAIRIAQSKALSPAADEPASLSRDDKQGEAFLTMAAKIKDQDLEISRLKARVKSLEDKERRRAEPTQEDAPITRGIIDIEEELGAYKSTKLGSNDTEEMVNVLSSIEAANILSSGGAAASVSPADVFSTTGVSTVSESFPTVSAIFTTASVVAREMEEEFARENQRLSEQLAKDYEIARLHAEEELKIMIEGLDRSNESKPLSKKEQREFYMSVLRSHARWKTKHLRGMTLEQLIEKFILVWKQWEDFVPMSSKKESERVKRQGIKIDQGSLKRVKISKGVSEEELKGMMQIVPLEEVYIEALQIKHPIIDWEIYFEGKREY
nr:synaptobrevin, longin-like domain protein [Tanacetum cinerariifolium]